ncbi:MAG TPA: metalloregulator ArsR/SmtB family transcription factor [Longimicrobiales bacterium]
MNRIPVFQQLSDLADPARGRVLRLLERHELTVGELCAAVQMPQSTVSRHLKLLTDGGWLAARAEGTSRYYRLSTRLDGPTRRLWEAVREELNDVESAQDLARAADLVARRRTRSQEYFSQVASDWDGVRAELFGAEPELRALPALLHPSSVVADLGCGTGQLAATFAPFVRRVIGVDDSADMLGSAAQRLASFDNVELLEGRLESLPIDDETVDLALLSLVLHYVADPAAALADAARVLRPVGRVLLIDMLPHGRDEYRERMGHVWRGFAREQVETWFRACGLTPVAWHALPPAHEVKGPLLFVAVGRKR